MADHERRHVRIICDSPFYRIAQIINQQTGFENTLFPYTNRNDKIDIMVDVGTILPTAVLGEGRMKAILWAIITTRSLVEAGKPQCCVHDAFARVISTKCGALVVAHVESGDEKACLLVKMSRCRPVLKSGGYFRFGKLSAITWLPC